MEVFKQFMLTKVTSEKYKYDFNISELFHTLEHGTLFDPINLSTILESITKIE